MATLRQNDIIRELKEQIQLLNKKKPQPVNELIAIGKAIARLEIAISMIDNHWWEKELITDVCPHCGSDAIKPTHCMDCEEELIKR